MRHFKVNLVLEVQEAKYRQNAAAGILESLYPPQLPLVRHLEKNQDSKYSRNSEKPKVYARLGLACTLAGEKKRLSIALK